MSGQHDACTYTVPWDSCTPTPASRASSAIVHSLGLWVISGDLMARISLYRWDESGETSRRHARSNARTCGALLLPPPVSPTPALAPYIQHTFFAVAFFSPRRRATPTHLTRTVENEHRSGTCPYLTSPSSGALLSLGRGLRTALFDATSRGRTLHGNRLPARTWRAVAGVTPVYLPPPRFTSARTHALQLTAPRHRPHAAGGRKRQVGETGRGASMRRAASLHHLSAYLLRIFNARGERDGTAKSPAPSHSGGEHVKFSFVAKDVETDGN